MSPENNPIIPSENWSIDEHGYQSLSTGQEDDDNLSQQQPTEGSLSFKFFYRSSGPPQVLFLSILYAFAAGCTVGVIPSVMTSQYAHVHHGLDPDLDCSDSANKIQACIDGNGDALTAASVSSFVSNVIIFFTSSLFGSISDEVGRRPLLLTAQGLSLLHPLVLVLIQLHPRINPAWFYAAYISSSFLSFTTISLSAISDVIPHRWRASCFGLLFCGFFIGFALAPFLAIPLSHYEVSLLSLGLQAFGFFYGLLFLPETLSKETSEETRRIRKEANEAELAAYMAGNNGILLTNESDNNLDNTQITDHCFFRQRMLAKRVVLRPIRELLILNRNNFFRLLSLLAFFSGISSSGDQTLLLYYAEQRFSFDDHDVAYLFLILGILGIIVQSILLNAITLWFGEKMVVVLAFFFGALHNVFYAIASDKNGIFIGAAMGSVCLMAFPTISAIKSNNVDEREQGQIQGALYAISSLASALGPATLRIAYQKTKETKYPGAFFLVGTICYLAATFCAMVLPKDKTNSNQDKVDDRCNDDESVNDGEIHAL